MDIRSDMPKSYWTKLINEIRRRIIENVSDNTNYSDEPEFQYECKVNVNSIYAYKPNYQ